MYASCGDARDGVGAVLLAAGMGRRFGGAKLLAPFRGQPLLSHSCSAVGCARDVGLLAAAWGVAAADDQAARYLIEGAGPVIRPRYAEQSAAPGHPVLLDREVWQLAHHATGDDGLADLLPAPVVIEFPGANPDIDTLADLHRLEEPAR